MKVAGVFIMRKIITFSGKICSFLVGCYDFMKGDINRIRELAKKISEKVILAVNDLICNFEEVIFSTKIFLP
jgi:hypothetical protein